MKRTSDRDSYFNSDKSFHALGTQPRKSDFHAHKQVQEVENSFDEDEKTHQHHRAEPNKKMVRVQLRRIERLY